MIQAFAVNDMKLEQVPGTAGEVYNPAGGFSSTLAHSSGGRSPARSRCDAGTPGISKQESFIGSSTCAYVKQHGGNHAKKTFLRRRVTRAALQRQPRGRGCIDGDNRRGRLGGRLHLLPSDRGRRDGPGARPGRLRLLL